MGGMAHRRAIDELRERIQKLEGAESEFRGLRDVQVEEIQDADGEPALQAVLILPDPGVHGWPVRESIARTQRINKIAADLELAEYVYLSMFTEQERSELASDDDRTADDEAADAAVEEQLREQRDAGAGESSVR